MHANLSLRSLDPRRSLTARMFLVAVLLVTATLAAVTFFTARTVRDRLSVQIGENFQAQADGLGELMGASLMEKVGQLQTLALSDTVRDGVAERNASYTDSPEEILAQIQSLDKRWLAAADDDPLIVNTTTKDPTVNPAGDQLAHFLAEFGDHTEVFVTDRYGATVVATGRLSDYYQADEDWWKRGWNDGAGAVYISDPEFDESAGVTALLVAVPVVSHSGEPIGVLRSTLNVGVTFSFVADVALGETGHAVVFGEAGEVLFDPRTGSGEGSADLAADLRQAFAGGQGFEIALDADGDQSIFGHFAVHVDPTATGGRASAEQIATAVADLGWTIVVRQEASEALATVDLIVQSSVTAGLIAAVLAGLLALLATRAIITQPLVALQNVAEKIGRGDLRTPVPIRGPDEIASLGGALEHMRAELQGLYSDLEQRVEQRTQELSRTNEKLQGEITERQRMEETLRQSEERTRTIIETAYDAFISMDADGVITAWNAQAETIFGWSHSEAVGRKLGDTIIPPQYREAHQRGLKHFLATGEGAVLTRRIEITACRRNSREFPVELVVWAVQSGEIRTFNAFVHDISERKQLEEALRESEAHTRAILDTAVDAIITIDERGTIESFNQAAERMFGFTAQEAAGKNIRTLMPQPYRDEHDGYLENYARTGEAQVIGCGREVSGRRKDGTTFPMELSVAEVSAGGRQTFTGIVRDITERKRLEDALREQARRDPLTGALNHGAILAELRNLLANGGDGGSHAVAMVDVDGLKTINDTYGHQVGDAVLVAVTQALSKDGALVGRYGGDEFVAVLPGADRTAAQQYRDDVLDTLAGADLIDSETGASVAVVASIGLATYPQEAGTIAGLIGLADSAMYASRRQRPIHADGHDPAGPVGSNCAAEMVGQIVPLLTSPAKLEDNLKLVAQRISVGTGYDAVNIDLYRQPGDPPSARNVFARVPNEVIESWRGEQRRMDDDPFVQLLLRTRRGIIVDDPQNDGRLTETQRTVLRAAQLRSAAVVPLFWGDELIGVLSAASKREAAFTARDIQFLTTVASQVTAIVRMASLVEELQTTSSRLVRSQEETVLLLAAAAEAHDHTTGIHLHRVRTLTEALASELGYSEDHARELALAAVLHDIGKIRVPESVLASTGQLAGQEWELMQRHTTWGAQFLADRPSFALAATIARSHHERCDGSGYPDGLSGEAIPEAATIVAVADSFDAMTHDRPYKAGRSIDQAVREITACSGTQFSPRVVAALERLYQRNALPLAPTPAPDQEAAA